MSPRKGTFYDHNKKIQWVTRVAWKGWSLLPLEDIARLCNFVGSYLSHPLSRFTFYHQIQEKEGYGGEREKKRGERERERGDLNLMSFFLFSF